MDDSDYLRLLTIAAEQANAFLSNARKWERERWVCQRLLQGLNIPYRADEFAPAGEPPDVLFRDANFEVFFVLDEGRRLNDEWRDELQRRRSAFSLSQLVRREAKPKRIPAMNSCCDWRRPCAKSTQLQRARHGSRRTGHHRLRQPQTRSTDLNSHFPAHRIPTSGLALAVARRPDLRPRAVRPPGRAGFSAQQPRSQHRF